MGCKLDQARDWATRIHHEAQLHQASCFLTLTFSDEHLPPDLSVSTRDLQLFMKRLRKKLGHGRVRYFGCGEYGEQLRRPHYHLILFGYDFPDRRPWRKTKSGFVVARSAELETVWPFGHAEIGTVTTESAGYVARYVTKKVSGDDDYARAHYRREKVDPVTGEVYQWQVQKEFIVMSTRPGIGAAWFDKFATDAFPSDFVVIEGRKTRVPRYYSKKLEGMDKLRILAKRKEKAALHPEEQTDSRLITKHESQILRATRLTRELDNET